jgi:hypothetical protein
MDDPEAGECFYKQWEANSTKDIADNYFGGTKTGIPSPNPGKHYSNNSRKPKKKR